MNAARCGLLVALLTATAVMGCGGGPVAPSLGAHTMPGPRGGPPGVYGWEADFAGGPTGMHRVTGVGEQSLFFAVGPNCLGSVDASSMVPVNVAGFNGVSVEPYDPPLVFGATEGDETTRAYRLDVADRKLCAFVTWDSDSAPPDKAAAIRVLDTLRAQLLGTDGLRINFLLEGGWDTG